MQNFEDFFDDADDNEYDENGAFFKVINLPGGNQVNLKFNLLYHFVFLKNGALIDSTIFLVDCTKNMFSIYDDRTYFEKCMNVK
jgi:hypothetical protein